MRTAAGERINLTSLCTPPRPVVTSSPVSQAAPSPVAPGSLVPSGFRFNLRQNQYVGKVLDPLKVDVVFTPAVATRQTSEPGINRESVTLQLVINGKIWYKTQTQPGQSTLLPDIPLAPGRHKLQLVATNAQGTYRSPIYQVFNLEEVAPADNFILVDKGNFALYFIQNRALKSIYPIAIGRPRTPTPAGYWVVGEKKNMSEIKQDPEWGSIALLMYRREAYSKKHWSGYAIHGTNDPDNIGKESSYGCIYLYDHDALSLAPMVSAGTPVIVREALKVYIDKI